MVLMAWARMQEKSVNDAVGINYFVQRTWFVLGVRLAVVKSEVAAAQL